MNTTATLNLVPYFLYGTAWKEDKTQRCVENALKAGFRGIDTANQRKHYYEAGVGKALQSTYESGLLQREDVFLQTKFTPRGGQDNRLPYDPQASLGEQVQQSCESSLEHLGTDWLDSFILHGPMTLKGLSSSDWEIWQAMESLYDRGKVRYLGVSNVSLGQLQAFFEGARVKPSFVQSRCFAIKLWDRELREYCQQQGILYQGFSLLTANAEILQKSSNFKAIAQRKDKTPAQIVFRFAWQAGMLPLTGTTDFQHMQQDLQINEFELTEAEVAQIENVAAK
ncbi:aldo/keto reductase [Geitlerinema sp. PCC 9228]|jgi:diketogulonate reductase-like aldo/keto reductase|uniref:aldo/keto reductase family protein n=1 Tax=Geitlerinema sp. PCC 9228 TaxID=111611 RepID=UPI000A9D1BD9|nr:aldo/keto reductase [Geitlerinema sp. PCC 9228]